MYLTTGEDDVQNNSVLFALNVEIEYSGCRARGIDPDVARQVLVYSFGAEVTQHLKHKQLIQRVQEVVASTLAKAPLLPVGTS